MTGTKEDGLLVDLSPLPYSSTRRTDPESALALKGLRNVAVLARTDGTLLALFPNDFWLEQVRKRQPEATLEPLFAG